MKSPGEPSLWTHKTGYTFKNRTAGVREDAEQPKLVGVRTGLASREMGGREPPKLNERTPWTTPKFPAVSACILPTTRTETFLTASSVSAQHERPLSQLSTMHQALFKVCHQY